MKVAKAVRVVRDVEALSRAAAEACIVAAQDAVARSGRFTFVLTGGSTPKPLYSLLASDPQLRARFPWQQTFFFFGDERFVPPDDPQSNYRMANEAMLSKAPIDASQVFRMKGELADAAEAASEYEQQLKGFFQLATGHMPRFDLVLMGMGANAHTASLFPHCQAMHERRRLVTSEWIDEVKQYRITMTVPVFNHAAQLVFLVAGRDKAPALKSVLEGPYEPEEYPSQLIAPEQGNLAWLVDEAAAAQLDRSKISAA